MDIQGDSLTIPDTEYAATVKIPSAQFQKICRDLTVMGDTITIEVTKGGIHFSANGDLGSGNVCNLVITLSYPFA
jgi:proliferating cell nuclear antigen